SLESWAIAPAGRAAGLAGGFGMRSVGFADGDGGDVVVEGVAAVFEQGVVGGVQGLPRCCGQLLPGPGGEGEGCSGWGAGCGDAVGVEQQVVTRPEGKSLGAAGDGEQAAEIQGRGRIVCLEGVDVAVTRKQGWGVAAAEDRGVAAAAGDFHEYGGGEEFG